MRFIICVIALIQAGCALVVHATPVSLPDGAQGYAIHCNGAARDVSDCMNEAARVCGGKYRIVSGDQADVGGAMTNSGNGAVMVRGIQRTLIVSCGPS